MFRLHEKSDDKRDRAIDIHSVLDGTLADADAHSLCSGDRSIPGLISGTSCRGVSRPGLRCAARAARGSKA